MLVGSAGVASAAVAGDFHPDPGSGSAPSATTVVVEVTTPGGVVSHPASGGGAGTGPVCWYDTTFHPGSDPGLLAVFLGTPLPKDKVAAVKDCVYPDGHETHDLVIVDVSAPFPPPDAQLIATQVRAQLPIALGVPATAPSGRTLTGLPTWVWVDPGQFRPVSSSQTLGPLTVTVTATPTKLVVDPGDGRQETCTGPGVAWHHGAQVTDPGVCAHTYTETSAAQPGGVFEVTVTAVWEVRWTASDGQSGTLAPVQLANRAPLRVQQLQPVLDP